ncbi:MAG: hypothetical protein ACJ76L_11185 [Conexibacter sp.]
MDEPRTVRREVRSADPSLSDEANRLLTEEVRKVLGRDVVEVPAETPERHDEVHGRRSTVLGMIAANRLLFAISLAALIVVGAIVSLATGSWWALVAACAVHATGTVLIAAFAIGMTTRVEHVDPTTAARLEAEGVSDPDRVLSELTDEFAGGRQAAGAAEVVSTGHNDNLADPDAEPARSALEQRTVMTPSAEASSPAGSGSVIGAMPLAVVAGLVVISLMVAILEGGWTWPVPVVAWGGAAVWAALALRLDGRAEERAAAEGVPLDGGPSHRQPGDTARAAKGRLAPVLAAVVIGVAGFAALVALLMTSV